MDEASEIESAFLVENLANMVADAIKAGTEFETADLIEGMRRAFLIQFGETINSRSAQSLADMVDAVRRLREHGSQ